METSKEVAWGTTMEDHIKRSSIAALIICSIIVVLILLFVVLYSRNIAPTQKDTLPPGYYAAPSVTHRTLFPSHKTPYSSPRTTILNEGIR